MTNRILAYTGNIPVNQSLPRNKNKLEISSIKAIQTSQISDLKKLLHKLYKSRIYGLDLRQESKGNLLKITVRFETSFHAYDPEFYKLEKLLKKNLKTHLELESINVERPEGYNKPEFIHKGTEVKVIYEDGIIYDEESLDKALALLRKNTSTINQNRQTNHWNIHSRFKDTNKEDPELN